MGMLDGITGAMGGLDLEGLAAKVGLTPEQVQQALAALGQAAPQPGDTAGAAAAQTGLPTDKLQALLAQVGGEEMVAKVSGMIGGAGGLGGLAGGLGGMFGKS